MNGLKPAAYFDTLVFIGRFQPLHVGHLHVIRAALAQSKHVLLLCGSANRPRSASNPFSFEERRRMILDTLSEAERTQVSVLPLNDYLYHDAQWVKQVRSLVAANSHTSDRVGLIGHAKDHTSYYLSLFPEWSSVDVSSVSTVNATDIRHAFFSNHHANIETISNPVAKALSEFVASSYFNRIKQEIEYIDTYKQQWQVAPYPPNFVTVDALVVCKSHVLVIQRKHNPGKGLLALPGGFVDPDETLIAACLRELAEETQLNLQEAQARSALIDRQVFDEPRRSVRGRTITHVYYFELADNDHLPSVSASDDAIDAYWLPINELNAVHFFEDHYFIIQSMLTHKGAEQ